MSKLDDIAAALHDYCPQLERIPTIASLNEVAGIEISGDFDSDFRYFLSNYNCAGAEFDWVPEVLYLSDASSLKQMMSGYAYDSTDGQAIESWPDNYLIVGQSSGDPIAIRAGDKRIMMARHGLGTWNWLEISEDFVSFLSLVLAWQESARSVDDKYDPETFELSEVFIRSLYMQAEKRQIKDEFVKNLLRFA